MKDMLFTYIIRLLKNESNKHKVAYKRSNILQQKKIICNIWLSGHANFVYI